MRKLILEFTLSDEVEEDYEDVCTELIVEDFFARHLKEGDYGLQALWDSAGLIANPQGEFQWIQFLDKKPA